MSEIVLQSHNADGKLRCRFIRTRGDQCGGNAMTGHHYCWHHTKNLNPVTGKVQDSAVPFLDDAPSIQLVISRTVQDLFDNAIDPSRGRALIYAASVANAVLNTQILQDRALEGKPRPVEETVSEVDYVESQLLAPRLPWLGPTGRYDPEWAFSKWLYEQECERAGKPKPACAADFPPEGWLTEDEIREKQSGDGALLMMKRYEKKLAAIRKQRAEIEAKETAEALAAGLPDPHAKPRSGNPDCPFGIVWCNGLRSEHHCGFCSGFAQMKPSDPRYPGDEIVAKVAAYREYLKEKKKEQQRAENASEPVVPALPSSPRASQVPASGEADSAQGARALTQPAFTQPDERQPEERHASDPSGQQPTHLPQLPALEDTGTLGDLPDPSFESEPDTDEHGQCWCGGPSQGFPCHECREKKEDPAPGLDLKAVAETPASGVSYP